MLEQVDVELALGQGGVDRRVLGELHDLEVDAGVGGLLLEDAPRLLLSVGGADADGVALGEGCRGLVVAAGHQAGGREGQGDGAGCETSQCHVLLL